MTDPRHALGLRAEAMVAERLRAMGWRILARRWKVSEGELDLVRGRRSARSGSALESVDRRHLARLRAALVRFAASEPVVRRELRVDLVAVDRTASGWRIVRHPGIDGW